jgi:hypothetical protein
MVPGSDASQPNLSFRVTPEMRAAVKQNGQALYSFPGPITDALKSASGQAVAGAAVGAALDRDHPLAGALAGAGAALAIRHGMVARTVAKLARAEREGALRGVLEGLDDDALGVLADKVRRWKPALAERIAAEPEHRLARMTMTPAERAEQDLVELVKGPLRPLVDRPAQATNQRQMDTVAEAFQGADRDLRHRIMDHVEQAMEDAGPAHAARYQALIDRMETEGYQSALPATPSLPDRANPEIDAGRYVNLAKFDLDPRGERRLADHVQRLVEAEGMDPKSVVTWDQVRETARDIGIDPGDIDVGGKGGRMSGAEMLAVRNQIRENVTGIEEISRNLAMYGETMPDAQRDMLNHMVASAEAQNSTLLNRFIRSRTQAGRDLNSLKILANQTVDPLVWEARAAKRLRAAGLAFTETHRATIRNILAECQ